MRAEQAWVRNVGIRSNLSHFFPTQINNFSLRCCFDVSQVCWKSDTIFKIFILERLLMVAVPIFLEFPFWDARVNFFNVSFCQWGTLMNKVFCSAIPIQWTSILMTTVATKFCLVFLVLDEVVMFLNELLYTLIMQLQLTFMMLLN